MNYQDLEETLYTFKFTVSRIVDADSIKGIVSRGFNDYSKKDIRLSRIDAWEIRKAAEKEKGKKALAYVETLIKPGDKVVIRSLGEDSFGRVVSEVYLNIDNKVVNLSDLLVQEGHAIYVKYKGLKKY